MRLTRQLAIGTLAMIAMVACMIRDARAFDCLPQTPLTPLGKGVNYITVTTSAGECGSWWCPVPQPDGTTHWFSNKQCVLTKFRAPTIDALAMLETVLAAPDALSAVSAAASAASVNPSSAQDAYDYAYLKWSTCNHRVLPANMPPGATVLSGACGAAPTLPAASSFVVAKNGANLTRPAFPVINGKRSFSSDGTVAVGSPCSDAVKFVEGSLTFLQVSSGHVAVCSPTP